MATWLWIKGVPGPPQNDGWLEALRVEWASVGKKAMSVQIPRDGSSDYIMQLLISGQEVAEIMLFREPQSEMHFYECMITSASSGGARSTTFNLGFDFRQIERVFNGSP